jgi:hypothetical protein
MWLEIWDSRQLPSGLALAPGLEDLLACFPTDPGYTWRLLELYGEAKGMVLGRTLDELESAASTEGGLKLSWAELQELARSSLMPYDITLAGFDREDVLPRSLKDEDLAPVCRAIIRMVDSTLWRLYETDPMVLGEAKRRFRDVRPPL